MKIVKRGLAVAAMMAATFAVATSSASAAITPDPYATSSGTGSFSAITTLFGTSTCSLSNLRANATGTATGAVGTVTGFTVSGCSNAINSGSYVQPVDVEINSGAVRAIIHEILIVNVVGGECSYRGTLTGTMANGGNRATVRGNLSLHTNLNSWICSDPAAVELTVTFPGASVTW